MYIFDSVIGYLLIGGIFLIFTAMNYHLLVLRRKKVDYIPSPAPFIGGLAGALLVIVIFGFKYPLLILLPLFIDPGSIPLVIRLIICMVRSEKNKS